MLRDGPKQTRLLYGPAIYEMTIPEDHYFRKLDDCLDWKRTDMICRHLYSEDMGRPVKNLPRIMFKTEVLQIMNNWTDREVREHARYNIAIKWFLELQLDEEPFDFTSLSKFRVKLGVEVHTELFLDILSQIKEAGFLDHEVQFIDTTAVEGNAAVLGTTQLIKKASQLLIKEMEENKCKAPVTFEKKESLQKTVEKALNILETASDIPEVEHNREILKSILDDYVEITDDKVKERKKKGKNRIVNVFDEDVRWGAKSNDEMWAGFKVGFPMTRNRFVTGLMATSANVTDETFAIPLYEQQESKPSIMVGDGAFGTGKNRRYFKKNKCTLAAPLRGQENPTKLFSKKLFLWDGKTVTCPGGKTTDKYTINKRTKSLVYRFKGCDCQTCSLKPECTTGKYRTITISHYQKEFDEAEKFNATPEYKALMKERPLIESKNSEVKHPHGLDRARYRGVERMTIQALLTMIVVNLKNFIRLLMKAQNPPFERKLSIPNG